MRGLLDIAPRVSAVPVAGGEVDVCGVSVRGIAHLLAKFPALQSLLSGRQVDAEKLIAVAPDAIAAIIAAGCGQPGDAEAEAVADRLPIEDQAALISAILKLTMPKGVGPFVEMLNGLGGILNLGGAGPEAQATKSPKPSKP